MNTIVQFGFFSAFVSDLFIGTVMIVRHYKHEDLSQRFFLFLKTKSMVMERV